MPIHHSPSHERVVIYRDLAYRRLADRVVAMLPDGGAQAIAPDALPLPVRRALNLAASP
jgi:hypothetical protein